MFGRFDNSNPAFPNLQSEICNLKFIPAPAATDAVFARLDDRAGAITDDYDSPVDEDDSSNEAEDGLDVWGLL